MTDSLSLVTAQISFLNPSLSLIHIPTSLYTFFIQPIFQLLFSDTHSHSYSPSPDPTAGSIPWTNRHAFLNVTITPVEVSIICDKGLADLYFTPVLEQFRHVFGDSKQQPQRGEGGGGKDKDKDSDAAGLVDGFETAGEEYIVIQVDGQGLDAGQRILELTSPLAMAGISIFFITTYFSDYILVPARSRRTVTTALEQRGFVFSQSADAFVSQLSPSSPSLVQHTSPLLHTLPLHTLPLHNSSPLSRATSLSSPPGSSGNPSTPPAKDIPELQTRTFTKLRKNGIVPRVDRDVRLVNCAGNDSDPTAEQKLKNDLMQILLATTSGSLGKAAAAVAVAEGGPVMATASDGLTSGTSVPVSTRKDSRSAATSTSRRPGAPKSLPLPLPPSEPRSKSSSTPAIDYSTPFLSLTITSTEPISLFLEQRLLHLRRSDSSSGGSGESIDLFSTLLGAKSHDDVLIPITLDLRGMPIDMSGIVCGVAGRLAQGSSGGAGGTDGSGSGVRPGGGATEVTSGWTANSASRSGISSAAGITRPGSGGHSVHSAAAGTTSDIDGGAANAGVDVTFLSTAKAGIVLVRLDEVERAVAALEDGMRDGREREGEVNGR